MKIKRLWLGMGIALLMLSVLLQQLEMLAASDVENTDIAYAISRINEPIVMRGDGLTAFVGKPISELLLYVYQSNTWKPVPFQIDEREDDAIGTFVSYEDGIFDANDELVFMAHDLGEQEVVGVWPDDLSAKMNERYEIVVNDPLHPGQKGWAYLYHSNTLPKSNDAYIAWNIATNTLSTISYTAVFAPDDFLGLSDLYLYGGADDVLDRQKIRASALFGLVVIDEEDLAAIAQSELTIGVYGPIRGVGNDDDFSIAAYVNRFESDINLRTNELGFSPEYVYSSFDLNDPSSSGLTTYYDSNNVTTTIDGSPDTVDETPPITWYQVAGSSGSFVVAFPNTAADQGTVSNHYKDDETVDTNDTGDQKAFGETGLRFDNPGASVNVSAVLLMMPQGSSGNVGDDYFQQVKNPLTVTSNLQAYELNELYLPIILNDGL
ncbi:MAG: hypothetical protein GY943_39760 [Chloroflexi bacterium]|nr:hypothetical protein [Chloroflexota bacterium]